MFKQISKQFGVQTTRSFSTSRQRNFKVAYCGACGGIGQAAVLLLKMNKLVTQLNLYDLKGVAGVAADLSHIDTKCVVCPYQGRDELPDALDGCDVVVVSAGKARRPGMTRDDLFDANASVIWDISAVVAETCPKAIYAIITNPVNTIVPIAAEVLKKADKFDPKRLVGVSTLDVVRARKFIGDEQNVDPQKVKIDVIAGHSGITIIPVISQSRPKYSGDALALTRRIQEAGTEVVKAKAGAGSATLAMAYAGAQLVNSVLRGLKGECGAVECAFVSSDITEAKFFATPVRFGKNGIEKNMGMPKLNDLEKRLLAEAMPELLKNIKKGIDYVNKN